MTGVYLASHFGGIPKPQFIGDGWLGSPYSSYLGQFQWTKWCYFTIMFLGPTSRLVEVLHSQYDPINVAIFSAAEARGRNLQVLNRRFKQTYSATVAIHTLKNYVDIRYITIVPSYKLTKRYWKWPFIVDLPIKSGDVPVRFLYVYQAR